MVELTTAKCFYCVKLYAQSKGPALVMGGGGGALGDKNQKLNIF
jgi:hypothetical protein